MSHEKLLALDPQKKERLLSLDQYLSARIIGQDHVIPRIASVIRRGELGLTNARRPKGSFIFLGPTGVGKTEITLELSRFLYGTDEALHRFDMSEFMLQESLPNLIGDVSGEIGRLGRAVQGNKKGILLFDEMEKAHPLILDVFLQLVDAGRLTVGKGDLCDVTGFYIVFTTNISSAHVNKTHAMPWSAVEKRVLKDLSETVRPEFAARINEKVVFKKLDYDCQRKIAELVLENELKRHYAAGFDLVPDPEVFEFLVRRGFDRFNGARPMRNAVESSVQDAIARHLLTGDGGMKGRLIVAGIGSDSFLAINS